MMFGWCNSEIYGQWLANGNHNSTMEEGWRTKYANAFKSVDASEEASEARCRLLSIAAPALKGGQSRAARGGMYLFPPDAPHAPTPSRVGVTELVDNYFAFIGDTDRYIESVCAFHLTMGGPPAVPEEVVDARQTPSSGIDWVAEGQRCGFPIDDDPDDELLFALARAKLDGAIAAAGHRFDECMAALGEDPGDAAARHEASRRALGTDPGEQTMDPKHVSASRAGSFELYSDPVDLRYGPITTCHPARPSLVPSVARPARRSAGGCCVCCRSSVGSRLAGAGLREVDL